MEKISESQWQQLQAVLEKKGYGVQVFDTAQQAAEHLNRSIDGTTVGFGGSMTLRQMGLYESLGSHNTVYWHWLPGEGQTMDDVRKLASDTPVYLLSANGLALTGELINIDGACNRIASSVFGHQKIIFVIGQNKLAPDFEGALWRARNIAAPKNAQRLHRKTPCAAAGDRCYDCSSPERICRGLTVLWEKPSGKAYEIVLVKEDLGY